MLGYVGSVKYNESHIWDYVSVVIFQEAGHVIETYRAKVFLPEIKNVAKKLHVGDQVAFDIKTTKRGSRVYTEMVGLQSMEFEECTSCGKPTHAQEPCPSTKAQRLVGDYRVVDVADLEWGRKIVLRQQDLQFTYCLWNNGAFLRDTDLKKDETVTVTGWRDYNRITTLRVLEKKIA